MRDRQRDRGLLMGGRRLCLCGYMWCLLRPWPHRLRLRINVTAGLAQEVAARLKTALGVRGRAKGRAEVLLNRPQDLPVVAAALGCPENVLDAIKQYAQTHAGCTKGIAIPPELRQAQTSAAFQCMLLRPVPNDRRKVKPRAPRLGL